jgi:hypothetical protein
MMRYLLSVHTVGGQPRDPRTDKERQESFGQLAALEKEMSSTGAWVFSGRLHEPDTATVVRQSGGEVLTTDALAPTDAERAFLSLGGRSSRQHRERR